MAADNHAFHAMMAVLTIVTRKKLKHCGNMTWKMTLKCPAPSMRAASSVDFGTDSNALTDMIMNDAFVQ